MNDSISQREQFVETNGIELCCESFGAADAEPLVLIMGLAAQMTHWDDEFCQQLADRGFRVIRFDNRDVGRSTKMTAHQPVGVQAVIQAELTGRPIPPPYLLRDMAEDTIGLMDAFGIRSAHVVGASMGGAIAQELAINHPDRLRSLTSIMATSGDPSLPPPTPEAMAVLMAPPPKTHDDYITAFARNWKVLRGPNFPEDEAKDRLRAERNYERGLNPAGVARQLHAIIASGSRKPRLGAITVPTLVIHGTIDPLVPPQAGEDVAKAVPGAKLVMIPNMGHALPIPLWPQIIDAIVDHARAAAATTTAARP
ncbi:alpha/beta fold hydrolase [Bradyrhizobium sp. 2TAF24]|uniref:alpha/beta fold hydrolase n=1 Tax=Bradyrhizobium sp. 2TAF24 TaxID=3233011 RepID=UPI003F8EE7F0